ncbi:MAG: alpha/beta fold hydrolase [Verrucomicrobiota bacterium]
MKWGTEISIHRLGWTTILSVGAAFVLGSCSVPGIRQMENPDLGTPRLNAFAQPQRTIPETRAFLRASGEGLGTKNSRETLMAARQEFREDPSEEHALVLAELLSDRGEKLAEKDALSAAGYFLGAAEVALPVALQKESDVLREIYNFCCGRVAMLLYENRVDLSRDQTIKGPEKDWVLNAYRHRPGLIPQHAADEVWATSHLKLKGFEKEERIVQEGYGASMVGHRFGTPDRVATTPFLASVGMSLPASVTFDFSGDGNRVELAVYDALLRDEGILGGQIVPLSIDYTAPLATLASHVPDHQAGFKGMLNPDRDALESGLFEIEPHRPDQIPVIFVHGLMSSPGTWTGAVNSLRADARLRETYQLLVFFYPTGFPIPHNAALLRNSLRDYQEFYDPHRRNSNMRRTVLIGHSMGGILSNMQLRDSGDSLESQILTKPIAEIDSFTPEQKKLLSDATLYTANRDITRAIFVASPHRGCELASGWVGHFGNSLIHFRSPFDSWRKGPLSSSSEITSLGAEMLRKPPTSIQELESNSLILTTVLEQPLHPGVVLHSIIGNHNGMKPDTESSDQVVPYWSSHLDNAVSEKVVKANHISITENEDAIQEIRRILYLHAGMGKVPE